MRSCTRLTLAALFTLCLVSAGYAVPQLIHYQGVLTDGGGTPITTTRSVQFRIWNLEAGGTELWMESQNVTPNGDGVFSVSLGAVNPIPDSALIASGSYLGMTISSDAEMSPRTLLSSAPYSYKVSSIHGASAGELSGTLVLTADGGTKSPAAASGGELLLVGSGFDTVRISPGDSLALYATDMSGEPLFEVRLDPDSGALMKIREPGGGAAELNSNSASFANTSGDVTARFGEEGMQMFATGAAKDGAVATDTIFDFDPVLRSIRIGTGNVASGSVSIAIGTGNRATAANATAIGTTNKALGTNSVAFGRRNDADSSDATVSGGRDNLASARHGTIGGGLFNTVTGDASTIGGGFGNTAIESNTTVSGGINNVADVTGSTVGGGGGNHALGISSTVAGGESNTTTGDWGFIGGGVGNHVQTPSGVICGGREDTLDAEYGFIGGGQHNVARGFWPTLAGGQDNVVDNLYAVVSGGFKNEASGAHSVVPGGDSNRAVGDFSFAAGRNAAALHGGAFVWGDSTDSGVSSSAANQFTARASGGVRFFTNTGLTTGSELAAGGGSWASVSDRNVKQNIRPVDGAELLDKIAQLEVSRWNYESQDPSIEHIGPMAQDIYRMFGVGDNDRTITTVDPDGIALAAIKELINQNRDLSQQNGILEQRVDELERLVNRLLSER